MTESQAGCTRTGQYIALSRVYPDTTYSDSNDPTRPIILHLQADHAHQDAQSSNFLQQPQRKLHPSRPDDILLRAGRKRLMVDSRVGDDHIAVWMCVEVDERLAILRSSALCSVGSLLKSRIMRLGRSSWIEIGVWIREWSGRGRRVVDVRLIWHCRGRTTVVRSQQERRTLQCWTEQCEVSAKNAEECSEISRSLGLLSLSGGRMTRPVVARCATRIVDVLVAMGDYLIGASARV